MSNKKHLPPAKLNPEIYRVWLKEQKEVLGGTLKLIRNPNSNNEDDVNLEAYQINSEVLPESYAKDLMIFGYYNEIVGFKIWVAVDKYCYLLMAHQTHSEDGFTTVDGRFFKNHPHFHEIDFDSPPNKKGEAETLRQVPPSLYAGINSAELLNAFIECYYIDDGTNKVSLPERSKEPRQKRLDEPNN